MTVVGALLIPDGAPIAVSDITTVMAPADVGDALVQAGDQQTAYASVNHVRGSL